MTTEAARILIVEDEVIIAMELENSLTGWGYDVIAVVNSGKKALAKVETNRPDVILMDINIEGDMDGVETSEIIKARYDLPIIFITSYADDEKLERAKQVIPFGYLIKPVQDRNLKITLEMALFAAKIDRDRKNIEKLQRVNQLRRESLLTLYRMGELSTQKILDFCLERSLLITESELSFVGLINPDESIMTIHSWSRSAMDQCEMDEHPSDFPISEAGLWGEVIRQRRTIVVNDYARDGIIKKGFPLGHVQIRNFLSIPVFENGSIVCVVAVANKSTDYGNIDTEQLMLLMDGAWQLIKQVRHESEKAELQKQLQELQKIEAIGTLAGGIAHDFNNILHPILGYLALCQKHAPDDEKLQKYLSNIATSAERAKALVTQILTFSRQTGQLFNSLNPTLLIQEIISLLKSLIPANIEIRMQIENNSGLIMADENQLHQVLMNLATNAYHAMQDLGGVLTIGLNSVEMQPGGLSVMGLEPGTYICISVSDTGTGMSRETMDRICEPYFTTKEKGKGTGLGLAVVSGIVKSHGGLLVVESELNEGSVFKVYFPRIQEKTANQETLIVDDLPRGQERILVVDDEKVIAELESIMLEGLGYTVTYRSSAVTALELFKTNPAAFDVVITDMTMPVMTGDKLARELLDVRPDLPIIICTGFSERLNQKKAKDLGVKAFLMKPVSLDQFAIAIREALEK